MQHTIDWQDWMDLRLGFLILRELCSQTGPFERLSLELKHSLPQKVLYWRQAEQLRGEKQARFGMRHCGWPGSDRRTPGVDIKGLYGLLGWSAVTTSCSQIIGQTCCDAFQPSRILAREGRGWRASKIPNVSIWSRGEQIQCWHCAVSRWGYPCHSVSSRFIAFGSKR